MSSSTGKRSSPSLATPPSAKRTRTTLTLSHATNLTRDDALDLSHAELVDAAGNARKEWTEDEIKAKVAQVAKVARSGIKVLSIGAGFYQGVVSHPLVLYSLFNFEVPKTKSKQWKQKKLTVDELENALGDLTAPIRFGQLRINSREVTLHFDSETNAFKISGTYGLSATHYRSLGASFLFPLPFVRA
ncbi:hypothetical protein JCM10296v2_002425 [Rhodotorula toruloides]